jgi:hypothetical protein
MPNATGQALVALAESGALRVGDASYQCGVHYLLETQLADGSWYVKPRAIAFQPYFESGFPRSRPVDFHDREQLGCRPDMSGLVDVAESQTTTDASGQQLARHELLVMARQAALIELARRPPDSPYISSFLTIGGYWIDRDVVVERDDGTPILPFHLQTEGRSLKP